MNKRTFRPFYVMLLYSIMSSFLFFIFLYIFIFIRGVDKGWNDIKWWYTLIAAFCISIPFCTALILPNIIINLISNEVSVYYFVDSKKNNLDYNYNWNISIDLIEKISVVKLSSVEKRRYTSSNFLFRKYLKVELKNGKAKYIYIALYSNRQIRKIIKILLKIE